MGGTTVEIYPGIEQDPDKRFGKPCLKGTRVDVATVLGELASGEGEASVHENYDLTEDQIQDALRYAAHVADHVPPVEPDAA